MSKRIAVLLVLAVMFAIGATTATATGAPHIKVTLCHATSSGTNPYVKITVNVNSIGDALGLNGHGIHGGDIIPPFTYGNFNFPGRGNQSILANGCNVPTPPPPTQPPTEEAKVKVCHVTDSATNPYVEIEIAQSALPAHQGHGDLYPVPEGGCPRPQDPTEEPTEEPTQPPTTEPTQPPTQEPTEPPTKVPPTVVPPTWPDPTTTCKMRGDNWAGRKYLAKNNPGGWTFVKQHTFVADSGGWISFDFPAEYVGEKFDVFIQSGDGWAYVTTITVPTPEAAKLAGYYCGGTVNSGPELPAAGNDELPPSANYTGFVLLVGLTAVLGMATMSLTRGRARR